MTPSILGSALKGETSVSHMGHVAKCQHPCTTGDFDGIKIFFYSLFIFYSLFRIFGELVALTLDLFPPTAFKRYLD